MKQIKIGDQMYVKTTGEPVAFIEVGEESKLVLPASVQAEPGSITVRRPFKHKDRTSYEICKFFPFELETFAEQASRRTDEEARILKAAQQARKRHLEDAEEVPPVVERVN